MGNTSQNKKKYNNRKSTNRRSRSQNTPTDKTTAEARNEFLKTYRTTINKIFEKMSNGTLSVNSLTKNETITYKNYKKSDYRTYISNIKSNENNLVLMSQFLSKVCTPYNRILWYYATIPLFYWNLSPSLNLADDNAGNSDKILSNYYQMCKYIDNLNLPKEMRSVMYVALRDGAYYGVVNEFEDNTFFQQLDPKYCKPVQLDHGVWNFAFDFSFFAKRENQIYLENWDSMFRDGYAMYQQDSTNNKWILLDPLKTICIKADNANYKETIPFFVGMFEPLLDLIDARTLQRNRDIVQNYKMVLQKIPISTDKHDIDEFSIELDTAMKFYNMLLNILPDGVGAALTPMDIDTIDFKPDDNANDLLSSSMKSVFDDSGVSEMLFNSQKSGSIGLDASIKTDVALSWQLVESIEKWVQRYIIFKDSSNSYNFEILKSDIFNRDKVITSELSLANNGLPNKMRLAASAGMNPLNTLSSLVFENDILDLASKFVPLQTSFTMSSSDQGGAPEKDESDLSDEGASTKDKGSNQTEV